MNQEALKVTNVRGSDQPLIMGTDLSCILRFMLSIFQLLASHWPLVCVQGEASVLADEATCLA